LRADRYSRSSRSTRRMEALASRRRQGPSMSEPFIRVSDLCFSWPNGSPVFERLSFALGPSRTGLVAANGVGKSTLLRLLAGQLDPLAGHVDVHGTLAYLPQHLPLSGDLRVSEVLGIKTKLQAVRAIAAGGADAALFEV